MTLPPPYDVLGQPNAFERLVPLHSIAIFFGFLDGTFGLAYCILMATALWQSRHDSPDDPALHPRWVRPVLAIIIFPIPLMMVLGGGTALWWGFRG